MLPTASLTCLCQQESACCVPYLPHYGSIYVHATKIGLLTSGGTTPTGSRRGGRARNNPHLFNFHSPCRKFDFAQGKKGSVDGIPPVSPGTAPNRCAAKGTAPLSLSEARPTGPSPPGRPRRDPERGPPARAPGRGRRTGHAAGPHTVKNRWFVLTCERSLSISVRSVRRFFEDSPIRKHGLRHRIMPRVPGAPSAPPTSFPHQHALTDTPHHPLTGTGICVSPIVKPGSGDGAAQ